MKLFDELMIELSERKALNIQQRQKMARRMAKLARSSAFKSKVARKKKKLASSEDIHKRALKTAKKKVIAKYSGIDPKEYSKLSPQQKLQIDQRITSKKGAMIQKIAKKLIIPLKKAEVERLKKLKQGTSE